MLALSWCLVSIISPQVFGFPVSVVVTFSATTRMMNVCLGKRRGEPSLLVFLVWPSTVFGRRTIFLSSS